MSKNLAFQNFNTDVVAMKNIIAIKPAGTKALHTEHRFTLNQKIILKICFFKVLHTFVNKLFEKKLMSGGTNVLLKASSTVSTLTPFRK